MQTDNTFNKNGRPRGKLGQIGSNYRNNSSIAYNINLLNRLDDYEYARLYDTTVAACFKIIINTVVSSLGDIEHPDPDIENFLKYNVMYLENNTPMSSLKNMMKLCLDVAKWSGNSVSEKLFVVNKDTQYNGALLLSDLITYHPKSIIIRPNKQGRLVEGDIGLDGKPTGIWQRSSFQQEVLLQKWKIVHLVNNFSFNSFYGRSDIETIEKHVLLKEYILDLRTEALRSFGAPLVAITVPVHNTTEEVVDPTDGSRKTLTTFDTTKRDLQETYTDSDGKILLLPFTDPTMKPEAKMVTSGTNVGSSFEDAIKACDKDIARGLCVPYIMLSSDVGIRSGAERQIEIFNQVIADIYESLITPFINQLFSNVIEENFKGRASALIPAKITFKNKIRPEDKVAMMQMITGLTSKGYYNPLNAPDWDMVREMVGSENRQMDAEDIRYINDILITPLQKDNVTSSTSSGSNPERDRTKEGNVKGKGDSGRPVGISKPLQTPRE
jgi:hypothetical protein